MHPPREQPVRSAIWWRLRHIAVRAGRPSSRHGRLPLPSNT